MCKRGEESRISVKVFLPWCRERKRIVIQSTAIQRADNGVSIQKWWEEKEDRKERKIEGWSHSNESLLHAGRKRCFLFLPSFLYSVLSPVEGERTRRCAFFPFFLQILSSVRPKRKREERISCLFRVGIRRLFSLLVTRAETDSAEKRKNAEKKRRDLGGQG